jgi:hypothetical protein
MMAKARPLADFVEACLGDALAAKGFARSGLVYAWPDIVGEPLARYTDLVRIDWPRSGAPEDGPPPPATLVVRVESAFALDLQHLAPLIVERVNGHFGWRCIGKLALRQGPVRRRDARPSAPPTPSPRVRAQVAAKVEGTEPELAQALQRLGEAVLTRRT